MEQPIYFMYQLGNDGLIQGISIKTTEDIFKAEAITN